MHSAACSVLHIWQPQGLFLSCNVKIASCQLCEVDAGSRRTWGRVYVCMFMTYLCGCCLCTGHYQFVVSQVRCTGSLCLPVNETHCVDYSIQAALWKTDEGNEAACMKAAEPETQFCAKEIIEQQLDVDCVELRGHFSYEEGKYFPAWTLFVLLAGQGSVPQIGLKLYIFFHVHVSVINFLYLEWFLLKNVL